MRLEHIGIAVQDAPAVVRLYEQLLGVLPYKDETVAREGVRTHFLTAGTAKLELLEALGPESPVAKYLAKRGEGLHHLAFEVPNAAATLARLREAGFQPLSDEPRPGADGKYIFFLHPKQTHGVLIEFCQSVAAAFTGHAIPFRDGSLMAYERGRKKQPAVLLLHDASSDAHTDFTSLIRVLEPHFHLLALDFSAHGASTRCQQMTHTPAFYAENVRALLDYHGLASAHICGYGMGGDVVAYLGENHPERVQRGVSIVPSIPMGRQAVRAEILSIFSTDASSSERDALSPKLAILPFPSQALLTDQVVLTAMLIRAHLEA